MMTFDSVPYTGSRLDASLELAQKISDQWGVHALMIQMSRDMCRNWRTRTRLDEARAIYSWISNHVRYVPDPHGAEMLADPLTTIKNGGDCDDQAILAAALLQAHGHDARIGAVTWEGRKDASHAVVVDLTANCIVDPVGPSPEAWPPAPYKVSVIKYRDKAGQMQAMNGLFSKIFKAVAKPFQKIFPAHTLLGKIVDPLGLTDPSRNLNLAGRIADVAGTAASLAAGGWAIGAATSLAATGSATAAGGFWSTAGLGAQVAGSAALHALGAVASGTGTVLKALAPALLMGGGGGQAQAQPQGQSLSDAQMAAWANQGYATGATPDMTGQGASGGTVYSGGGGGGGSYTLPDGSMGATVPVTDTMPPTSSGMPLLLIAGGAVLLFALAKKRQTARSRR